MVRARLFTIIAAAQGRSGRYSASAEAAEVAGNLAAGRAPDVFARAAVIRAELYRAGRGDEASVAVEEALASDLARDRPWALLVRAWLKIDANDERAADALQEALDAADEAGDAHTYGVASQAAARHAAHGGRLEDAARLALDAIASFEARGDLDSAGRVRGTLGDVLFRLGDLAGATRALRTAATALADAQSWATAHWAYSCLSGCLLSSGDKAGAEAAVRRALDAAVQVDDPSAVSAASVLIAFLAMIGRVEDAARERAVARGAWPHRNPVADASLRIADAIVDTVRGHTRRAVEILAALLADDGPARDDVLVPALEAVALAAIPSFPFDAVVLAAAAESRIHGVPGAADVAFAARIAPVRDGLGEERAGEARAIGRQLDAHAARRRAASLLEVLRVTA